MDDFIDAHAYMNSFEIPIIKYEKDLDTELGKGKKDEILELFTNFNNICSEEEFREIEYNLHEACREGDVELIKIYLSRTIKINSKSLKFKIDKTNRTASLSKIDDTITEVVIPRTVGNYPEDYLVTSICGTSHNIEKIKFEEDSAVKTIHRNAIPANSDIEELHIPASLIELKDGWCNVTNKLVNIVVSPLNDQFVFKENKYLFGKSDKNNNEFDIFLFAIRNIEEISIPSTVTKISQHAFEYCRHLMKVEIPSNSNLQIIDQNAFCHTGIKEISIPSTVLKIGAHAFRDCHNLRKVEITPNSNLQTIGKFAFHATCIKEIFIPSSVLNIGENAFELCRCLTKVEIAPNSNLQAIESFAFAYTLIKEISIPPTVTKIGESAFETCADLKKIEIPSNSNLQTIEKSAFFLTKIEELYFPESLRKLKEGWFNDLYELVNIVVSPLNDQFVFKENKYLLGKSEESSNEFDTLLFASRKIKRISIPSTVKKISQHSFEYCKHLTKVEIPLDSNLQIIDQNAFCHAGIKEIFLPSKVSKISNEAFKNSINLTKVEIAPNSNLQIIGHGAFFKTRIKSIFIPPKVSEIGESAFENCQNLQIIEISENSKLKSFPLSAFSYSPNHIIMIPSSLKKLIPSKHVGKLWRNNKLFV